MNKEFLSSYLCLDGIFRQGTYSVIALNEALQGHKLKSRALITKIVYGVLDNAIQIDYIISQFATSVKPAVKTVLRIGVYCLKWLAIPPYTVVNECAELTKTTGKMQLVAFVNGTLRNIGRAVEADSIRMPMDKAEYISVYYSFPLYAVKLLIAQYGIDTTIKLLEYKPDEATHLRVNTAKITPAAFRALLDQRNIRYSDSVLPDCLYLKGSLSGLDTSLYTSMSLGSCLIARALGVKPNTSVLDVCAAPGGKAVYIATLRPDACVTACDIHPHRVELINSYAARLGIKLTTMVRDATVLDKQLTEKYDYVLCDVPCSGFGVFYTKPDIKYFRKESSLAELTALQRSILQTAASYVKPGGTLLYSTCSLLRQENSDIVNAFLRDNHNFAPTELLLDGGYAADYQRQFIPHLDGVEGFYLAKLRKC